MKKHIYLTGFMGAGKSRIGRMLAETYNWPFTDTDKWIERETGQKVKQIFDDKGEKVFRDMECRAIRELSAEKLPYIIALGGGALQREENYQTITSSGILVYIKSSPQAVLHRVKHNKKRPLLAIADGDKYEERLLQRITDLMASREHMYLKADLVFDRDHLELEQIVQRLKLEIERHWKEVYESY